LSADLKTSAYIDESQDIAFGQRISQPSIVAVMTDALELGPTDRVLEVGTGSGFQAAVLAQLATEVYSIEVLSDLAAAAARLFVKLGLDNVHGRTGDGRLGWPEAAPFAGIIVACAIPDVPPALQEQLASGGRLVAPMGDTGLDAAGGQQLTQFTKRGDGTLIARPLLAVRFVPVIARRAN
jgi:protein-L-isoaspartate(D-aspartate) O-methyltransferase